eukprot:1991680-Prymnesium_polylepis.1
MRVIAKQSAATCRIQTKHAYAHFVRATSDRYLDSETRLMGFGATSYHLQDGRLPVDRPRRLSPRCQSPRRA